jgi:hypothetical protein
MPLELVELIYRNVPKGVTVVNAYGELGICGNEVMLLFGLGDAVLVMQP